MIDNSEFSEAIRLFLGMRCRFWDDLLVLVASALEDDPVGRLLGLFCLPAAFPLSLPLGGITGNSSLLEPLCVAMSISDKSDVCMSSKSCTPRAPANPSSEHTASAHREDIDGLGTLSLASSCTGGLVEVALVKASEGR